MNPVYLLDTNTLSEPLRPAPNPALVARLREHAAVLAVPVIVWHELLYGAWRLPESKRRRAIERYLFQIIRPTLPILPYDERAVEWYAAEQARLAQRGRPLSFADGQIAAIAGTRGLTLVTANTADFADFQNLTLENWLTD